MRYEEADRVGKTLWIDLLIIAEFLEVNISRCRPSLPELFKLRRDLSQSDLY